MSIVANDVLGRCMRVEALGLSPRPESFKTIGLVFISRLGTSGHGLQVSIIGIAITSNVFRRNAVSIYVKVRVASIGRKHNQGQARCQSNQSSRDLGSEAPL